MQSTFNNFQLIEACFAGNLTKEQSKNEFICKVEISKCHRMHIKLK